ncbi:hypothetical protein RJ639_041996 [Escallonia herrerae]|uniref:Protein kinase domain-containing protein n=1 Tax=Escallonia herrerae TaxID=1293975 RepID=A0AA88WIE7_9ASTE|nr:hypothetical protein RJ639_041996 [Escallonia herrerae]
MAVKLNQLSLSKLFMLFSLFFFSTSLSDPADSNNTDFTTLFAFKLSSDPTNSLSSWSSNSTSMDPCSWLGVTCHSSNHRVIKLVLNSLNLTGSIHPLTRLAHLRHLSLHHNHLSSPIPALSSWPRLNHLYLSHNRFDGKFPACITRLRRLSRLDLSHNHFSGDIPVSELTQLPHLLTLRLEFNSFTGSLYSEGSSSDSVSDFNVSYNKLAGKIPDWLSKFRTTSFQGNARLCGKPLPSDCLNGTGNPRVGSDSVQVGFSGGKEKRNLSDKVVLTIIIVDVVAVLAMVMLVTSCCFKRRNKHREGKKENVMHVVRERGNRGPGRTPLDWSTRLKLASGSAAGVAFLHSHNKSKLFHGHLTSSSIIVDHLGNACISDIGLHQLFQVPASPNNAYKAPELSPNGNTTDSTNNHRSKKFSQTCDVYSFGMVLLEILTGKAATSEGGASLVKWVRRVVQEEWTWEVFDYELLRYKEMEEEMVALLQVALLCLAQSPRDRPKMSVVQQMIEDIRRKGGREREARSPLNGLSSDSSPSESECTPNFISS